MASDSPPAKRLRPLLPRPSTAPQPDRLQLHLQETEAELDEQLEHLREERQFEHLAQPSTTQNNNIAPPLAPAPPTTSPNTVDPLLLRQTPLQQQPTAHPIPPRVLHPITGQPLPGSLQVRLIDGVAHVMIPSKPNEQRIFLQQQRQIELTRQALLEHQRQLGAQFATNTPQQLGERQRRQTILAQNQQLERQRLLGEQFARSVPYGQQPEFQPLVNGPYNQKFPREASVNAQQPQQPFPNASSQAPPNPLLTGRQVSYHSLPPAPPNAPFHPALSQRVPRPLAPLIQRPVRTPSLSNIYRADYSWIYQQLGEGDPPPCPVGPEKMNKLCRTYTGIDLDSKTETEVPEFRFPNGSAQGGMRTDGKYNSSPAPFGSEPMTLFHTPDVVTFCALFKKYLLEVFGLDAFYEEGILRMENLNMEKLDSETEGYILWADNVCEIGAPTAIGKTEVWKTTVRTRDGKEDEIGLNLHGKAWTPAAIVVVLIPKKGRTAGGKVDKFAWERDARFFYCDNRVSLSPVLSILEKAGLRDIAVFEPGTLKHSQLFTWLQQSFLRAVVPPDSQDYKHAMIETDCCPSILDPDNALKRLHSNEKLFFRMDDGRDLSDDRYLHLLHPAEREAASIADLKCAQYLFIKRGFFKAFYEEIYRSDKKIDPNASSASGRGRTRDVELESTPAREDSPMSTSAPSIATGRGRRRGRPSVRAREAAGETLLSTLPGSRASPAPTPMPESRAPQASSPEPAMSEAGEASIVAMSRAASTAAGSRSRPHLAGWEARKARVRTETAHRKWLEDEFGFKYGQAQKLCWCWSELGFFDEGRYLEWVKRGGMFEGADEEEVDEGDAVEGIEGRHDAAEAVEDEE